MILLADDSWEIKTTKHKGRGIFATKDIPAGTVIGDYLGKVIKTAEEDTYETDEGLYLMYYHDYASLHPTDVNEPGIHLINHACLPNCWMYTYKGHTLFFALRHIFKGEELTISYLLSPDAACDPCKHTCKCESILCYQSMHLSQELFDQWDTLNEAQAKTTKRERVRYGHELPKLTTYPDTIPDHPFYSLVGAIEQPPLTRADKKLPTLHELRRIIRKTGRTIAFPRLKTRVLGVQNGVIISEPLEPA